MSPVTWSRLTTSAASDILRVRSRVSLSPPVEWGRDRAELKQEEIMQNFGWQHYVLLALGAIGAAATYVAQTDPTLATAMHTVTGIDAALLTFFGILFPSAAGPKS
jgi:hypothetical protein